MDIIVCIKRVPDTETRVKIAADGKSLDPAGVQYIMAPYDEIAVEKALQLKEAAGEGTVTIVTLGPKEATKELRTALAMGADQAVHAVTAEAPGPCATAKALFEVVKDRTFDLLLCGRQATDADDAAVGAMLAGLLGLPCVTFVSTIEYAGGDTAKVTREIEGETEVLEVKTPCVLTAQKNLADPRYPGLKGIMAAKKKPLETVEADASGGRSEVRTLKLPPAREEVTLFEATADGIQSLLTALRNDKKVL